MKLLKTNPVVIGSRYVAGGGANGWNFQRRALSFGANIYARTLTGIPAHDLTAGFVGYQADAVRKLNLEGITSEGYAFQMEMKFHLAPGGNAVLANFPSSFSSAVPASRNSLAGFSSKEFAFPLRAMGKRITGRR